MDIPKKGIKSSQDDTKYFTMDNVENSLPKISVSKFPANLIDSRETKLKYISRPSIGDAVYPKELGKRVIQPKDPLVRPSVLRHHKEKQNVSIPISWLVRPLVNLTADRANGRAARVYKLGLRTPEGKTRDVYIILLFHQLVVGAIGGIAVGIETGYLSPPERPLQGVLGAQIGSKVPTHSSFMTGSTLIWRTAKRTATAGLLFNFIHKNIEESRRKTDWKNSAYAGALCGVLFGLRGGARGTFMGCTLFAAFGGISGFFDELKRKNKVK